MTSPDLQQAVAASADAADLHAAAPVLLLDLQAALGALTAAAQAATRRGRAPFRPGPEWTRALADVAYRAYLVADQTGVDLDAEVRAQAADVARAARAAPAAPDDDGWPVRSG